MRTLADVQELDPDDPRPNYVQISDVIRRQVASGELGPGERLPSHADIAAVYDVSVGTVKRAFGVLQDEGLIVTRQGQPSRVRAQPAGPAGERLDAEADLRAAIAALDRRLAAVERQLSQAPRS